MTFGESKSQGLTVFELEGKIMGDTSSQLLCDRLRNLISAGEKDIVLDFGRVKWINSSGIGTILSCVTSIRRKGGDLHFVQLGERVAQYFKITKLDTVLKIYETPSEAISTVASK